MKFKLALIGTFCVYTLFAQTPKVDTIRVMTYNLLNFPDGRNDCSNNLRIQNRHDTLAKVINYALPDIFIANEVQNQRGADSILLKSLNVNGRNYYQMAQFAYGNAGGFPHNAVFYNANKLVLKEQHIIPTDVRPIDHLVFYGVDPLLGTHYDTTFFEVFAAHLKAGSSSENVQDRYLQAQIIRDYVDARPAGRNYIIGGDFNVYRASESGYVKLTSGGSNPFKDPINRPGSWNNNSSFRDVHTQSTRSSQNIECGSTGGMDDRFDQLLVSANVLNGADSVRYITGSYRTLGNDGNHFNQSINAGTNSLYPAALVQSLYYMSDHLPVTMDLRVKYPLTNGLALQGEWSRIACHGSNDGTVTVTPHAGQAPYTYTWEHDASINSGSLTDLGPGQYCVVVRDANNQEDEICVSLAEPTPLTSYYYDSPEVDGCDGSIVIYGQGGVLPYSYSWSHDASNTLSYAMNLCNGDYTATITDANGCQTVINYAIGFVSTESIKHVANVNVYPNPTNGDVQIRWTGNDAISFEVLDLMGKTIEVNIQQTAPFETMVSLENLPSGIYMIRAIGANWITRIVKQ